MLENTLEVIDVPVGTNIVAEAEKDFWSHLKWQCLFCLLEQMGHLPISTLAKRSGLSIAEAVRALETMEIMNLVRKTDRGYEQTRDSYKRVGRDKSHHIEIISQYVLSCAQVNNRILETVSTGAHKTKTVTYNSTKELVDELYQKLQNAVDEFKAKSDAIKPRWDGVYNLSASIIELTGEG